MDLDVDEAEGMERAMGGSSSGGRPSKRARVSAPGAMAMPPPAFAIPMVPMQLAAAPIMQPPPVAVVQVPEVQLPGPMAEPGRTLVSTGAATAPAPRVSLQAALPLQDLCLGRDSRPEAEAMVAELSAHAQQEPNANQRACTPPAAEPPATAPPASACAGAPIAGGAAVLEATHALVVPPLADVSMPPPKSAWQPQSSAQSLHPEPCPVLPGPPPDLDLDLESVGEWDDRSCAMTRTEAAGAGDECTMATTAGCAAEEDGQAAESFFTGYE